jgi:transcriptional regulator with XRE-family HTH domain
MADKSNGQRLREWRESRGLSQAQAADMIGAKQGTWAPWESGKKCPSVRRANQLVTLTDGAVPVSGWSSPAVADESGEHSAVVVPRTA